MAQTPEVLPPTQPEIQTGSENITELPAAIETVAQVAPQTPQQQTQTVAQQQPTVPTAPPTPASNVPTVTIPTSQTTLTQMAQGNPADSMTWLAHFWERVIKKALKKGWHVVFGTDQVPAPAATDTQNQTTQTSQ